MSSPHKPKKILVYTASPPYPLQVTYVERTRKGKPIITQTTEKKDDFRSD